MEVSRRYRRLILGAAGSSIIGMKQSMSETVAALNRALAYDFRIMPLDVPDAPIFMAVAWPTAEGVTGLNPRLPAGRGTTLAQAMISAGAEALELRASLAQSHVRAFPGLERPDGRAMVMAQDMLSGEPVPVPAQQVYLDFASVTGEVPLADADSTGCATSTTRQEAVRFGLLECLERDAMALWWHGGLPCAHLPVEVIDRLQPRLFWWLQERERQTMLLDLWTDTGVTVVVAVSCDREGRLVAVGSSARPERNTAALTAITEMIQTETAMEQAAAAGDPEVMAWRNHASTLTMPQFQPSARVLLPAKPDPGMEGLLLGLSSLGHRVLAVDLTLPNDPLPTMRVIVPGLCAMGGRIHVPRFERLAGQHADRRPWSVLHDLEPY